MFVWYFGIFNPVEFAEYGIFNHDPMILCRATYETESVWLVPGTLEDEK
ncbi:MAG: hypothetical protein ACR2RF_05405 [Geminicoccaceae bacterium]